MSTISWSQIASVMTPQTVGDIIVTLFLEILALGALYVAVVLIWGAILGIVCGIIWIKDFREKRARERAREVRRCLALCYIRAGMLIKGKEPGKGEVVSKLAYILTYHSFVSKNFTSLRESGLVSYVAETRVHVTYVTTVTAGWTSDRLEVRNYGRRNNPYWVLFFKGQCIYDPLYDPSYTPRYYSLRKPSRLRGGEYKGGCRGVGIIE